MKILLHLLFYLLFCAAILAAVWVFAYTAGQADAMLSLPAKGIFHDEPPGAPAGSKGRMDHVPSLQDALENDPCFKITKRNK